MDEVVHVYLATGLRDEQAEAEDNERIEIVRWPLADLDGAIAATRDAKTLIGLLWLKSRRLSRVRRMTRASSIARATRVPGGLHRRRGATISPWSSPHLRTIEAVARHGSLTKAGEELYLSQSAISQQIRRLELELGFDVFRRTSRRVELTAEGRVILTCAQRVLAEVDGLHCRARGDDRPTARPAAHRRGLSHRPLRRLRHARRLPRRASRGRGAT